MVNTIAEAAAAATAVVPPRINTRCVLMLISGSLL